MASPKPVVTKQVSYRVENFPGTDGKIATFTYDPRGYVPQHRALEGVPEGSRLSSAHMYGTLFGLEGLSNDDRLSLFREPTHFSEIILAGWQDKQAVSCSVALDPADLLVLSQAGYAAHTSTDNGTHQFHELTYALQDKIGEEPATGSLVLAVRKAWDKAEKTPLPEGNWTSLTLAQARNYEHLKNLFKEEGLDGYIAGLSRIRGVTHTNYGSLIVKDLLDAGVTQDSGLVVARPSAAGGVIGNVDALSLFFSDRRALSVAVAQKK